MKKLNINEQYLNSNTTVEEAKKELVKGLAVLEEIDKPIVSFFGSHRADPSGEYYQGCKRLATTLGKKGYAIISGGGPGIMHAANSGAMAAKTTSVGCTASLLDEEKITDPIFTHTLPFKFLFARRFIMAIKSKALIFYPGGYGTLNELFEYVVLMQTSMVDRVPIICVHTTYWQGLFDWLNKNAGEQDFFIDKEKDIGLLYFSDNHDEIVSIIDAFVQKQQ